MRQEHDFSMDIFDADGRCLGRSVVTPDFAPLAEHVHFSGIRRGVLPAVMSQPAAQLHPVWHAKHGAPLVGGVRIEMSGPRGRHHDVCFPLDCFKAEAKRLSAEYVAAGALRVGDVFHYQVAAAPRPQPATACSGMALLEVEEIEQPLALPESSLRGLLDRSVCLGQRSGNDDGVVPVFVAQALVEQCVEQVAAADDLETGGILVGSLHRDSGAGEVFLEITAQLPARHADQRQTQLTFTDRTWAAARDELALRNSGESIVGWWHSHPDFCRNCTSEKRRDCYLNGSFFSNADCTLHRTIFPRAWQVGLLFSNRPPGIIPALFGWRCGQIKATPFYLTAPERQAPQTNLLKTLGVVDMPIVASIGGDENHGTH